MSRAATVRGGAVLRDRVTAAIAGAVIDELADHGYGAFSMNRVAQRAGVGKAALYRRWTSKEPMVVDIIAPLAVADAEALDTGSLDGDLRALLTDVRDVLAVPRVARIATDLLAESLRSPELAEALRDGVARPRRERIGRVLERASDRGELAADVDTQTALDVIAGAPLVRLATTGEPMDDDAVDALHRMLMRSLT